jgi:hypothetical protein
MLTFKIVTVDVLEFVSVTLKLLMLPTATVPKLKLSVLAFSCPLPALTVSAAVLLVTPPIVFVTITSKVEPLSDPVVAGVV